MNIVPINKKTIRQAIRILKQGGSVVFPTETAYGLAVDTSNKKAIKKVFNIKQRSPEKSLPWIAASLAMAKKYVKFSPLAMKLAKKYWPGPLTMVLPNRFDRLTAGKKGRGTVALRVSANKIAKRLSAGLDKPIISTSANISGLPTCYSAGVVLKQFAKKSLAPDLILDAGQLPKRQPSTIIKITRGKIKILRQGKIKLPPTFKVVGSRNDTPCQL